MTETGGLKSSRRPRHQHRVGGCFSDNHNKTHLTGCSAGMLQRPVPPISTINATTRPNDVSAPIQGDIMTTNQTHQPHRSRRSPSQPPRRNLALQPTMCNAVGMLGVEPAECRVQSAELRAQLAWRMYCDAPVTNISTSSASAMRYGDSRAQNDRPQGQAENRVARLILPPSPSLSVTAGSAGFRLSTTMIWNRI